MKKILEYIKAGFNIVGRSIRQTWNKIALYAILFATGGPTKIIVDLCLVLLLALIWKPLVVALAAWSFDGAENKIVALVIAVAVGGLLLWLGSVVFELTCLIAVLAMSQFTRDCILEAEYVRYQAKMRANAN